MQSNFTQVWALPDELQQPYASFRDSCLVWQRGSQTTVALLAIPGRPAQLPDRLFQEVVRDMDSAAAYPGRPASAFCQVCDGRERAQHRLAALRHLSIKGLVAQTLRADTFSAWQFTESGAAQLVAVDLLSRPSYLFRCRPRDFSDRAALDDMHPFELHDALWVSGWACEVLSPRHRLQPSSAYAVGGPKVWYLRPSHASLPAQYMKALLTAHVLLPQIGDNACLPHLKPEKWYTYVLAKGEFPLPRHTLAPNVAIAFGDEPALGPARQVRRAVAAGAGALPMALVDSPVASADASGDEALAPELQEDELLEQLGFLSEPGVAAGAAAAADATPTPPRTPRTPLAPTAPTPTDPAGSSATTANFANPSVGAVARVTPPQPPPPIPPPAEAPRTRSIALETHEFCCGRYTFRFTKKGNVFQALCRIPEHNVPGMPKCTWTPGAAAGEDLQQLVPRLRLWCSRGGACASKAEHKLRCPSVDDPELLEADPLFGGEVLTLAEAKQRKRREEDTALRDVLGAPGYASASSSSSSSVDSSGSSDSGDTSSASD